MPEAPRVVDSIGALALQEVPKGNKELAAAAFNARVIPSVAYTDPEVAWVGLTEDFGSFTVEYTRPGHFNALTLQKV